MTKRRTREETRSLLLDEGKLILHDQGLRGAGDVRLTDVFDRVKAKTGITITAGSTYERIWRNQRDFQIDLLAEVLKEYDASEIDRAMRSAGDAVAGLPAKTPKQRTAAKHAWCVAAAESLVTEILASRRWQIWVGVWGVAASTAELSDDERIGDVIEAGYAAATTKLADQSHAALTAIGLSLQPGLTSYQFGVALGSLTEGLALRVRYDSDLDRELSTNVDGVSTHWGLEGVTVEALVDRFYA